jgi:tRNA A-37 threonylcarbamoyl transferase component Bud32
VPLPGKEAILKSKYKEILETEVIPYIDEFPVSKASQIVGGRKGLYRFKLTSAELHTVVVRPCKRGGFFGELLKDAYWSKKRIISELIISDMALNIGIPVPEIIGVVLQPKGFGFYKGFVIMREIFNSLNLADYIKTVVSHDSAKIFHRKKDLIEAISGNLIKFHDNGFYHSDLNMTNLLVQRDDEGKLKIWIIDLDKSGHYEKLPLDKRIDNLIRLNRSLIKMELDATITSNDRLRFLKSYLKHMGEQEQDILKDTIHKCSANVKTHNLSWELSKKT